MYTLGTRNLTTSLVELKIKTQKGDDILMTISIVAQITGLGQRFPINIPEQENLNKIYHLAYSLPEQVQTSTLGLLTGIDNYHDLILSERIQVQDDFYLITSLDFTSSKTIVR